MLFSEECRKQINVQVVNNKKLSCRRETARRFVSCNILLSHSTLLNVIRNDTVK